MSRKIVCGFVVLISTALSTGCNLNQPSYATETLQPPIAGLQITATVWDPSHAVRLPLIKNGSELTPTPFLPQASTPIYIPTEPIQQIPNLNSQAGRPDTPPVTPVPNAMPLLGDQATAGEDLINILLIGSDQGSGAYFRTDTMIIASIRPRDQTVSLISIPRDLFVYIPGWTMQRINTAYLHGQTTRYPGGGAALLKNTILYNLGIRIDNLAIVDFNGFKKIVDLIDGVDVPLACPYTDWHVINSKGNLENPNNWRLYTVGPGVVHMDGDLALWYARSRLRSNDFDRGRRQQEVLRAIYKKASQLNVLPRLPELYSEMNNIVRTDIDLNSVLSLMPMALKLDAPRIRSYYISNKYVKAWWTPAGANVLLPKREMIEPMLQDAMSPPDAAEDDRLSIVIEISNQSGVQGREILAAERLHYAGFETEFTVDDGERIGETYLSVINDKQDTSRIEYLLKVLGLSADRLYQEETSGPGSAYRLVLGGDYNPCFNPSKVSR